MYEQHLAVPISKVSLGTWKERWRIQNVEFVESLSSFDESCASLSISNSMQIDYLKKKKSLSDFWRILNSSFTNISMEAASLLVMSLWEEPGARRKDGGQVK
jgi:hypothetical protein